MGRPFRQGINEDTEEWHNTTDQMDVTDIIAEHTFFSSLHWTFSRIEHILGHKISLRKFKKIEISQVSSLTTMACFLKSITRVKLEDSQMYGN